MDDLQATKSEDVGIIVRVISFQDFNLCGHDPSTSQTDRRTDRQTDDMRSQDRALHYSASRGKNRHCLGQRFYKTATSNSLERWLTVTLRCILVFGHFLRG